MKFSNVLVRKVHESSFSELLNKRITIELVTDGILFAGGNKVLYSSVKKTLTSPSRETTVKIVMDANNLKGVGIELQFPDVAGLGTFTGQLLGQTSTAPKKTAKYCKAHF